MKQTNSYKSESLSLNRKMVSASVAVSGRQKSIHSLASVDVTIARSKLREYERTTGEKLSFTAYIVKSLAEVFKSHPRMNSFIRRNRMITLKNLTISVLIEREFSGEKVPEPLGISSAWNKTFRQINDEIRIAKKDKGNHLGSYSGMSWIRFLPTCLFKLFVRIAEGNIRLAVKYGKVAVTAVGMFTDEPVWFIPHGGGTVLITVGSIEKKLQASGGISEFLSITGTFNHRIIDGAPAARFMNQFIETLKSGSVIY